MANAAFLIAGQRAELIANDVTDFRYRATAQSVPVGVQAPARTNARADTQFMLNDGVLEFMVGGGAAAIVAGTFVVVPAGVPYAYRNIGDEAARLLVRSAGCHAASHPAAA